MVLHDMGWASRFCDHVLMLFDNGHIITGSTEEILNRNNLEALYQCNMKEFVAGPRASFRPGNDAACIILIRQSDRFFSA